MFIHTKAVWKWDDARTMYVKIYDEGFEYNGPLELACGASSQQTAIANSQQSFMTQAQQQSATVFGNDSQVFNSLMSTFAPTIAAGPSQQGFSQQELSNLNSQAITQTGIEARNAKEAVGNAEAAVGGGTTSAPSGAVEGANLSVAENAANQTASELGQITQADYEKGSQNYENAIAGAQNATNAFNSATGSEGAATGAGTAAANSANQVAQANNSWMSVVGGALGAVAGGLSGGLSNMVSGIGKTGGGGIEDSGSDVDYGED